MERNRRTGNAGRPSPRDRIIVRRLEEAWNRGDGNGFAACFAPDADFVHIMGGHGNGRDAIAGAHRRLFETIYRGSEVVFEVEKVRALTPEILVVLTRQRVRFCRGFPLATFEGRLTWIVRAGPAGLEIVHFHNTTIGGAPAAIAADHPFADAA